MVGLRYFKMNTLPWQALRARRTPLLRPELFDTLAFRPTEC